MDAFRPADILIPDVAEMNAWSVVACDQFTSEPEYWADVYKLVGNKPSALNLILPEAELGFKDADEESKKIYATMKSYLENNIFKKLDDSFVYLERTLANKAVRQGIIGMFDLEAYDWQPGTATPIRATERTVEDRLPPRVKVREKALLEMPHIMIFIDDPEDEVFSSVKKGDCVYDFELMKNGGQIKGWQVSDNDAVLSAVSKLSNPDKLINKYGTDKNPVIFAMGDGNHSIAAAKKYWEQVKKTLSEDEIKNHPARFALAEVVNIHAKAITFEPIHKVLFGTNASKFIDEAKKHFSASIGQGKKITLLAAGKSETIEITDMTIGELIGSCEDFCKSYISTHGGTIDYIHGDEECVKMAGREDGAGILIPKMEKSELFSSVIKSGPFPKKSFSIGHGPDKRYYLECRKIK